MRRTKRKSRRQLRRERYNRVHKLAKLILFILQLGLTIAITAAFLTNTLIALLPLFVVKEVLYYLGLNTVAYLLENVFNYGHQHEVL